jgi:riboflavin synthase
VFTGLIKEMSQVQEVKKGQSGLMLQISRPENFDHIEIGESISVDGVCLTVTGFSEHHLEFFIGSETLSKTSFENLKTNQILNLERSLRLGDRLGGHLVSGHADGVAKVVACESQGECLWFEIEIPVQLRRWVIEKGSLLVKGVSLTINHFNFKTGLADFFLIPETLKKTNLNKLTVGEMINIECDQIVKIIRSQGELYEQHL